MPIPRTSYTGQAVFEANIAQVFKPKPRKLAPDNKPTLQVVIARYSKALEQGDEDSAGLWLDIYSDMTDTL